MISVLIEALNNVWNPWMFRKLDQDDTKTLRKAYSIYAFAFSAVTIVVAAVSPEVVKIVAPRDYWDGINFVLWVVFSAYMIFIYQLYVNIEFYEMKTYLISIGTVMAAAINIVLNLLFLKRFGYGFAAVSTLISYVALAIFHMIVCDFVIKRRIINDAHIWLMVTVTFGVTCILQSLREQMLVRWLAAVVIMAVLAAFCYRDYKKDDGILKQFKRK
jgi:O-antigen/teichoic acid export membrane protein